MYLHARLLSPSRRLKLKIESNVFFAARQSRVFSEFEGLRWHAGGTPDKNDEEVRAAVARQCRLSSLVVVKETRLAEVSDPSSHKTLRTGILLVPPYGRDFVRCGSNRRCSDAAE